MDELKTIEQIMIELDGADSETIKRIASKHGSLPVRLAMLGIAAIKKEESPLWWGYPPGVFISYKWSGKEMQDYVSDLAGYIRNLGYNVFLDIENLDNKADAYFEIPQYITNLQNCNFVILLLTEKCADFITARKGKTTWIFDEHQHATRLANIGRLIITPVLLEPKGVTNYYTTEKVIDLSKNPRNFKALKTILTPDPSVLEGYQTTELEIALKTFDEEFLKKNWNLAKLVLDKNKRFNNSFDYQLRSFLLALYTANEEALNMVLDDMCSIYGEQIVNHIYSGYCLRHNIPNMMISNNDSK